MSELREQVRARYAEAARAANDGSRDAEAFDACCGSDATEGTGCCTSAAFGASLYGAAEKGAVPAAALSASLGCGNPTAVADLHPGDTVLDLGSGAGGDVLLAARRVGPEGKVYGLDMTDEMLELAQANRAAAGAENVEFLKGLIEAIPLPDGSVDVVISNCVINLSVDKHAVFSEIHRVLRAGGRIGIADVVAHDALSAKERARRGSYVGCIAAALSFSEYADGLARAGFTGISMTPTHEVAPEMHSAIVKATKPRTS